jgi:lysophospholipase L1-like esterase
MKKHVVSLATLLALATAALAQQQTQVTAPATLKAGDAIAICGDSITEQKLYSVFMEDYLLMCQPQADLKTTQFGWGGERTPGFRDRMKNDALPFQPTVATTFYGMNDAGYGPFKQDLGDTFRDATRAIVKTFKDAGVREIVVGSPGVVDSDTFRKSPEQADVYNKTLAQFGDIAKQVATEEGVHFVDVHGVMLDAMGKAKAKYGKEYIFAGGDGVHPGPNGHLVTAYAFLKALGCNGDIATINVDAATGRTTVNTGHKVLNASKGSVELESTKYPFCFYGDPKSPNATRGIIEFFPFNEDLNRFMLVVKNAPADSVKVTWGEQSKTFSKADLEKGINLAAEFADANPFSEAFAKAEAAIKTQQAFETPATKNLLHNIPQYRELLPGEKETFERLVAATVQRDKDLRQASKAAVVPVRHTIKIEAAQ